jgi:SAM-dependent methyltransferase
MPAESSDLTRRVASYIQHRPLYPQAALEVLKVECGLSETHIIADIGCGPGILSQLFLDSGNRVIGVEPDIDMRAGADYVFQGYSGFTCVAGTAEATPLPDQSVDFVASGQAFHWFDPIRARLEFSRILRPEGWVALIWNLQRKGGTPFQIELNAFWNDSRNWNSERALNFGSAAWNKGRAEQDVLEPFFRPGGFKGQWFDNPLHCDLEGLKGRVHSTLPGLLPGEAGYEKMLKALELMFETHQEKGLVVIEHDTRLVYGQFVT